MKTAACLFLCLLSPLIKAQFIGDGSDGAFTSTGTNNFITDMGGKYAYATSNISAAATSVVVDNTTGFSPCDLMLIIQMDGANAGVYDLSRISSISGTTISFSTPTINAYTKPDQIQVVRIPEFTNVTIFGGHSLTTNAWNGNTGGIIWFYATGTVNISGTINANALGFKGGAGNTNGGNGSGGESRGVRGEAGTCGPPNRGGDAGNGNGGAGGDGGGGGNVCNGGKGGRGGGQAAAGSPGGPGSQGNGPGGGAANGGGGNNASPNDDTRYIMGSGGGGGKAGNGGRGGGGGGGGGANQSHPGDPGDRGSAAFDASPNSDGGSGGDGGGIIVFFADSVTGTGNITANGTGGANGSGTGGNGGNGGPGGKGANADCTGTDESGGGGGGGGDSGDGGNGSGGGGGGAGGVIRLGSNSNTNSGAQTITPGAGSIGGNPGSGGIRGNGGAKGNNGPCCNPANSGSDGNTGSPGSPGAAGQAGIIASGNVLVNTVIPNVIVQSSVVNASITGNDTVCSGIPTTITASGGNAYSWNSGNTSASLTVSPSITTTYTVTVNNFGCTANATQEVTVFALPATSTGSTPTACGGSTGTATVTATGSGMLTYLWSPTGQTTATASALSAGSYNVTVTDGNGCSSNAIVSVNNTSGPTVGISSQNNVLCYGLATGSATVTTTGGTGPLSYSWTPTGGSDTTATGLTAGSYICMVTDSIGCAQGQSVIITQPASAISSTIISQNDVLCNGLATGSATVTGIGGTPGYTYSWSPASNTTSAVTGLAAGTHSVTITDTNSCFTLQTIIITEPSALSSKITSQTNVDCKGSATGSAKVVGEDGTPGYLYNWNSGETTTAVKGLTAGNYSVTITDANSCTYIQTVVITEPLSVVGISPVSINNATCGNSNGSATVSAFGGTIGTGYQYSWFPSGGTDATVSGLGVNTYTVTTTDSNGCIADIIITINNIAGPTAAIVSQTDVYCNGGTTGSAITTATGGSGTYSYSWSGGAGTSSVANNLSAGVYTVTVFDGVCSDNVTVIITQPNIIMANVTTTPTLCGYSTGTTVISASGGTGSFIYLWNTGETTTTINNLSEGSYTVTITDSLNCTQTTIGLVGLTGVPTANAGADVIIASGANTVLTGIVPAGSSYLWTPDTALSCPTCLITIASPTQTTAYILAVTLNGCTVYDTVNVTVYIPCGELFVARAFSPNNDGQNDVLYVQGNCIMDLEFVIFDRWGEKVFATSSINVGWDGTYNGKAFDTAVFAYFLRATVDGIEVKKQGNITLVK